MLTIIIALFLLLLAVAAFVWIVNSAINKSCPSCDSGQLVIPIVPGFLAWCPQCGETYSQQELVTISSDQHPEDEEELGLDQQLFSTPEEPQEPAAEQIPEPEPEVEYQPGDFSPGPPRF